MERRFFRRSLCQTESLPPKAPFWNLIAVGLPLLAIVIGLVMLAGARGGTGDFGGRLGSGVLFIFSVGAACAVGEICSWVALVRGERMVWLSVLAAVLNGLVVLPLLGLARRP